MNQASGISDVIRYVFTALLSIAAIPCHANWGQGWEPNMTEDLMGGFYALATVTSENKVQVSSLYDETTTAMLALRKKRNARSNVILVLNAGQLMCTAGCKILVRFDDSPAVSFPANPPDDQDVRKLFIKRESDFIAKAKTAKRILIQVTFYQGGSQIFEFQLPKPLVWPPASF